MLSAVVGRRIADAKEGAPNKALVLQHRDELVEQNTKKFRLLNPTVPISIFDASSKSWNGRAIFGMVQTVSRNLERLPALDSLTIDEAHHATAGSYTKIIARAREVNPAVAIYGVTATPNRGDGTPLRTVFDNVADQISIGELIGSGHLVRPRSFAIDVGATQALGSVRRLASDFDMAAVAAIMDRSIITDAVVAHWQQHPLVLGQRLTVVFCSTVAHAEHVCTAFEAVGVNAEVIHGELNAGDRRDLLARFRAGKIKVLINVAVLTEGFDHPPISCVILLRPSSYKSTMVQMVGRGLRPVHPDEHPGIVKTDCVVLDFGTATLTHGALEEDANLDGRIKGSAPLMECPNCGAHVPISTLECPLCGFQWERLEKERAELRDFVLTEIDLLAKSNFKWVDIWGDERALIACGFDAWAGLFWWQGIWHALGGTKTDFRHLGVGERIVALALGDDYLNEHEDGKAAHKAKRWLREPATPGQLAMLGMSPLDLSLSKYQASCRITFKLNKRGIMAQVLSYAQEKAS
jgi:DNA repair protein RadD